MIDQSVLRQNWTPPELPPEIPHGDMPGDKVTIGESHIQKANGIFPALLPLLWEALKQNPARRAVVSVCGGSGVGKSEIASLLTFYLNHTGVGAYTLSGDNYPHRIPHSNDAERLRVFRVSGLRGLLDNGEYDAEKAKALEELMRFVRAQPAQALSQHYLAIFEFLTRAAGKTIWIERSGGSIAWLPEMIDLFPDGRYLHLYRDPLDVALSMQRHNHFRVRAFKYFDLTTKDGIRWSDLDESDLNNMPISPRLKSVMEHEVPLEYFLEDVNDCILRGMKEVKRLSPSQYAEISFEEIMADPKASLTSIADFFDLPPDEAWLDNSAALLKSGQAAHAAPSAEQAALLKKHCHAAMVLLGQIPALELYP